MEKKFMKRLTAILTVLLPLGINSCETPLRPEEEDQSFQSLHLTASAGKEIVFSVPEAATKASVTDASTLNQSGFKVSATKGTAGSETAVWSDVSFTKNGNVFSGNKWWPSTDPSYHFYASNLALTHTAAGATINVNTETDAVCAFLDAPKYNDSNELKFIHILARLGTITLTNPSNYDNTTVNSITLTPVISGIYNIRTGDWSQTQNGSQKTLTQEDNDLWCVPGNYTITVEYTLTKGDYVKTFVKTGNLKLETGKKNNLRGTLPAGDEKEITFTVTVIDWDDQNQDITFP